MQKAAEVLCKLRDVELSHWPREENTVANDLAQLVSGYKEPVTIDQITIYTRLLPSVYVKEPMEAPVEAVEDWRQPLVDYLSDTSNRAGFKM